MSKPAPLPTLAIQTQLRAIAAPVLDDWIGKVRLLVETAASLEDIRDGLAALLPSMTLDQYAAAMAEALRAAELVGRSDALDEEAAGVRP